MKTNSKRLIKFLQVGLDVAWYGNFLLAAVAFGVIFFVITAKENSFNETSSYVRTPRYIFEKNIAGVTSDVKNGILRTNIAYLSYDIKNTPLVKFSAFFLFFAIEFLIFSIIYQLRKLFSSLNKGMPFTHGNVETLKRAALYILLILPVQLVMYGFERYFFETNFPASYRFSVEPGLNLEVLIIAAVLYIMAEIFNHGLDLKKENEEFV